MSNSQTIQSVRRRTSVLLGLCAGFCALFAAALPGTARAQNAIVTENQLPGNPPSEWDLDNPDAGDLTIQGFATDISVNRGETVHFKIDTDAAAYHLDIYRMGYYDGDGARKVATVLPSATLPQSQPAPLFDATTGLTDCGNWAESASWDVPASAVSGIYFAKVIRDDNQGSSHIVFIVRDDASTSKLLFQTSDATWQAYNGYGGNSLYVGSASGPPTLNHASKVSYNRPFTTRGGGGGSGSSEDWVFNAEYPMVRWLERNGYDVSYFTDVDTHRSGGLLLNHQVFLSVGHDEYWSAEQRANVTAARDAGVHLAFFSGNEIYWKTRFEPSTDGSATPDRTLVCYKEGTLGENICGGKCDPLTGVWTGLWRDGCEPTYAPNDGCSPENALSGQISWDGNTSAIHVPAAYGALRFWRNTGIAALGSGQEATLGSATLGYEWDWQQYDDFYPAGRILLSQTDFDGKRHHLSLYRAPSGALVFGAGTVQWAWGLDSNHDRGSDPEVPDMQQATVNLLADMGVQPATLQTGLVAATQSTDVTAPVSAITSPADGAHVQTGALTTISGTASDVDGVVAGVEVSVDGGTTWQLASGSTNWTFAWSPGATGAATIRSRSYDDSGNMETPGTPVNVTVDPRVCPCTVFDPATVPQNVDEPDNAAIELGVKFRTSADGVINGIRFYKSTANTGTHVGNLWSSAGALIATTTFSGESASGWQEAPFAAPVQVTANTTYIASYHTDTGHYSQDVNAFASGIDAPPIRILADGEEGPNGVYAYAATSTFPTSDYQASNYWVDVVFDDNPGPDTTPPVVLSKLPAAGASGVAVTASVTAIFNEAIDATTVDGTTFELVDDLSAPVAAAVSYSSATRTATLTPSAALDYSATYTATLKGGGTDPRIKDLAGNALAADVSWSFTTTAPPPPPPTEGPGGPILVISAATNPFGRYMAEILRTEGFNEFSAKDISLVTPTVIDSYEVVILGEMALSAPQVTMLGDWTSAGGTLVAMRPDAQLAPLLGLTPVAGTLSNAYLLVNTTSGPGVGIVGQTIQFHGDADLYTLNGATAVATLYSDATTATANPAVTSRDVGGNGGQAIAFTYDLARSVVYTRQGNPAWAGQKRDGQIDPIRSDDQFFGAASFDPQPDWVDFDKIAIPQADEQQRLLANAIIQGNLDRAPLPRFWYLPKDFKAAIVMTGDDHGDAGMQPRFDIYINESPAGCSVDDWECVRATGYLYVGSTFTPAQAQFYNDLGFEVALHVNTNCQNFTETQYDDFITSQMAQFTSTYPSLPVPTTNRNHCIAWSDWSVTPEVEAANGIRFDTNYYYWPDVWIQDRPGMFTGSGMPMRFAKLDGTIIDCFQASTEMPDESGETFPQFCDQLLDRAIGPEGYYGVFTTNMHFDNTNHAGSNAVVASAQSRGVPVVSAKQMLDWLDGRNGSSFQNLVWNGNVLSFDVAVAAGAHNLRGMLPTLAAVGQLTGITEDGIPIAYTTETIKGIEYAIFPANTATYAASYAVDTTPPLISAVTATPHGDGTATIAWTTNEAADSRVDYGTDAGTLSSQETDAALLTSHSITLSGLAASTLYYFRVGSTDAASNAATEPDPPAAPLEFTMPAPECFLDATVADFAAGTPDANTAVTTLGDGDVILKPAATAEFDVLPPTGEWDGYPWSAGGSATVSGGQLVVDGARFNSEPEGTTYGPGTSVEFVATFTTDRLQHVGFGGGTDGNGVTAIFQNAPFALFSTGDGGVFVTRTAVGSVVDFTLPTSYLGSSHLYRIDWTATGFDYSIDGALVHTEPIVITDPMRPAASDIDVGGQAVLLDWIHVSPYAAGGSFTSRVYDAGGPANWDQMTWTADLPAGTSLQMNVRTGNTLIPDGTWTAYAPVASSGTTIGGNSRYIQYRADLATTDPGVTPVLQDAHVACTAGADVTAPVITNVVATPNGPGGATITWDTDEAADSRVDYGTDPGDLALSASDPAPTASHSTDLSGLAAATTYYYRVTSVDPSTNSATAPEPPASPLSFTTAAAPCPADVTLADFELGSTDPNTALVLDDDGEVILAPANAADFDGAALPAGWSAGAYASGGYYQLSGGQVTVDGAHVHVAAPVAPLTSVEFLATFTTGTFQNAGFAADSTFGGNPWVVIGEGNNGTGVYARNDLGQEVLLGAGLLGAPHRYGIVWTSTGFDFYVDGAYATTLVQSVGVNMVPIISDYPVGGATLSVDWFRVSPYPAAGSFTSRVFDLGGPTSWGAATWTADTPSGTGVALLFRTGDTAVPDGSWSAFNAVSNGGTVGGNSRYVQYRADLTTGDPALTPVLRDVALACTAGPDLTPPVISDVVAAPDPGGTGATVTWTTDEPADSRVDYGVSGGALSSNESDAALVTSHSIVLSGLTPGLGYDYRVTSTDGSLNAASEPVPPGVLGFSTPAQACFTDDVEADFAAGALSDTWVSVTANGEVTLAPAQGAEFSGTSLPADWTSTPWTGGTSAVAGGAVAVDGARLTPLSTTGSASGVVLEFNATFLTAANQHAGLGSGDNTATGAGMFGDIVQSWAMFSTFGGGTTLYARINNPANGAENENIAIGAFTGAPHLFRIEWKPAPDSLIFLVDGASVARRATTIALSMRPGFSDYDNDGSVLAVDWVHETPYATSGTFTSRVYDAGASVTWDAMTWTAALPVGTAISLSARTGDTAVPDGSWTAFAPVAGSGTTVGGMSRYIQYRADLSTSDPATTPVLEALSIACVTCDPTPPAAIADATADRGGSGAGGRIILQVSFTPPPTAATVEVYRAPFGGYPRYDDDGGATPATPSYPPGAPWTLTPVSASGQTDDPPVRDTWFYVVFSKSACDVVSPVSNVTAGIPNYLLGDVTDGTTACAGDGAVGTPDVSLLGSHYGETITGPEAWACLDVGPTLDGSVNGRPLTDGALQFEDLVMFALNFGVPGMPVAAAHEVRETAASDALTLDAPAHVTAGQTFEVTLRMSGAGDVQALSASLSWNAGIVTPADVRAGAMLDIQGGVLFSPGPGRMDAALLGAGRQGLAGEGDLAVWTFRATADGDPAIALGRVDARDAANRPVTFGAPRPQPDLPAVTAFDRVSPNPFTATTSMAFSLASRSRVNLTIYAVDGRRVRTLARGVYPAGTHQVVWNGTADSGERVRPGLYFARLETAAGTFTRSIALMR